MTVQSQTVFAFLYAIFPLLSAGNAFADDPTPQAYLGSGYFQLAKFSRNETRLLTATAGLAQIWDIQTGRLLQNFEGHSAMIQEAAYSVDGTKLLTCSGNTAFFGADDSTARLWNVATGEQLAVLANPQHSSGTVSHGLFSPCGRRVVTVYSSNTFQPHAATIWKLKDGEIEAVLSPISLTYGENVFESPVQFSPDGKWLLGFVNQSTTLALWNTSTAKVGRYFEAKGSNAKTNSNRFKYARWSSSGRYVLAILGDLRVVVWNRATGAKVQQLEGHAAPICDAYFVADDTQVLTASGDRTVRLWDIESGKQVERWDYTEPIQQMCTTPDVQYIVTRTFRAGATHLDNQWFAEIRTVAGESIGSWELPPIWIDNYKALFAFRTVVLSPSGQFMLIPTWKGNCVRTVLFDIKAKEVKRTF